MEVRGRLCADRRGNIADGAVTATQIKAAYEPLNSKVDQFEYCVLDFIYGVMGIAGIEDEPSFTRSMIVNTSEEIQNVVQAGEYLSEDYKVRKILTLFGDGDKTDEVLEQLKAESYERLNSRELEEETEEPEENEEQEETEEGSEEQEA